MPTIVYASEVKVSLLKPSASPSMSMAPMTAIMGESFSMAIT